MAIRNRQHERIYKQKRKKKIAATTKHNKAVRKKLEKNTARSKES